MERLVFNERIFGRYSGFFWTMMVTNVLIPLAILPFPKGRKPLGTAIVGLGVLVGMWIERYLIVVGTLSVPRLDYTVGTYVPSWTEIGIMVGSVGMFMFLYFVFVQTTPIVSIWEVREGHHIELKAQKQALAAAREEPHG